MRRSMKATVGPGSSIRMFEHTADIGFKLRAGTLEELFLLAAQGLLRVLLPLLPESDGMEEPINLEGETLDDLLVAWLDELLHLVQSKGLVPIALEVAVAALEPRGWRLEARASVAEWEPATMQQQIEVKGTTYHGLRVREEKGAWHANVIFDV
jgi:SHS2 domain-containing protein